MTMRRLPRLERAPALHDRAMEDLKYIRSTMASAAAFTAVPGIGTMMMGAVALAAAPLAGLQTEEHAWLTVWLLAATGAFAVGGASLVRKAQRSGVSLLDGVGRKFLVSLTPPLIAGALVTAGLVGAGVTSVLPGTWMLVYGAGVMSAGAFSVRAVPAMGLSFMALGALTLALPTGAADVLMALGFGGLHLVFGALIARSHGG